METKKTQPVGRGAAPRPLPYLVDPRLAALAWLIHGFGTRAWTAENFGKPGAWPGARLIELEQTHSAILHFVDAPPARRLRGDALATDRPGLILAIRTADCLPLLLADPEHEAVAAVHAGWRGTARGIAGRVVRGLAERYGARPSRLLAALGPCIGPACYEVGEDVRSAFVRAGRGDAAFRRTGGRDRAGDPKYVLDLRAANRRQLLDAGLPAEAVSDMGLCTHCDGRLLSYRRDRDTSARLYNFIGLRRTNR